MDDVVVRGKLKLKTKDSKKDSKRKITQFAKEAANDHWAHQVQQ